MSGAPPQDVIEREFQLDDPPRRDGPARRDHSEPPRCRLDRRIRSSTQALTRRSCENDSSSLPKVLQVSGRDEVRQVRISIPLKSAFAYLFIDHDQATWDQWWKHLLEYLMRFVPPDSPWRREPVQGVFVYSPQLDDSMRHDIAEFLRTAPQTEIDAHQTLRRATQMNREQEKRLELMYFK